MGFNIDGGSSASAVVSLLKAQGIRHVRLSDADHQLLSALAGTGVEVMVGVQNDEVLRIGQSPAAAAEWVKTNVATFSPATNITFIAVGDEVLTSIPNAAAVLVAAVEHLHSALVAADLNLQVKVSTPHSMAVIPRPFPPSAATFNSTWSSVMVGLLQFLQKTGSSFMLNAQPYHGYIEGGGIFPLDYALFKPLLPSKQIVDPNTLSSYGNMFDAMIDAAFFSMEALNFSGVPVLVTETGWPWRGGTAAPDATMGNALLYNGNLVRHVLAGTGTPARPNATVGAYIYELFAEPAEEEESWGLFFPNGTAVYSVNLGTPSLLPANSSELAGVFCVANSSAGAGELKAGIDWACGVGQANCSAIQPGQPCYDVEDIAAVASFAYNDYYHRMQATGGTCSFGGTAFLTTADPSE